MSQFNRDDPPPRRDTVFGWGTLHAFFIDGKKVDFGCPVVIKELDFTPADGTPWKKLSPMAANATIEGECTVTFESPAMFTEFVRAAQIAQDAFSKFREGVAKIARSVHSAPLMSFFETFIDTSARRYRRRLRARPKIHRARRFNGRLRPLRRNAR